MPPAEEAGLREVRRLPTATRPPPGSWDSPGHPLPLNDAVFPETPPVLDSWACCLPSWLFPSDWGQLWAVGCLSGQSCLVSFRPPFSAGIPGLSPTPFLPTPPAPTPHPLESVAAPWQGVTPLHADISPKSVSHSKPRPGFKRQKK